MVSEGVKQVVLLFMVLLVVALVVGGGVLAYKSNVWPWIKNLFFYEDTGIQPNTNEGGVGEGTTNVPAVCSGQYSECRICYIIWATDKEGSYNKESNGNYLPEAKSGEGVYAYIIGTEKCKDKLVWISVWPYYSKLKFWRWGQVLTTEHRVQFSNDKAPIAYFKVENLDKGQYYFKVLSDEGGKAGNILFKTGKEVWGVETNKEEAKSDNLVVK